MFALTSPRSGGRLVRIVRLRSKATEFSLVITQNKALQRKKLKTSNMLLRDPASLSAGTQMLQANAQTHAGFYKVDGADL
jgi:hypothetical protein